MSPWSLLLISALIAVAEPQSAALPVTIVDAPDGALLLRQVEARAVPGAVEVSGRVYRTQLVRSVVGRSVQVTLAAADGRVRGTQRVALGAAMIARKGLALSRFDVRLPLSALDGDVVTVTVPAVGATP
jgi:hypothetical protein